MLGNAWQKRPAATLTLFLASTLVACSRPAPPEPGSVSAPERASSILLVTLDTTRADSIGPEAAGVETPVFDALARRGLRFRQAWATAPETLPSHSSMMTGLYPAAHGIHENARYLPSEHPLLAERLQKSGYHTAAFVSAFPLDRRFGLARGFDVYDDQMPESLSERSAKETTDRALAWLESSPDGPLFVWVHYFDPHYPYEPPAPFATRYADRPYLGEIAAMDLELGRLVEAFEQRREGPIAIVVAGDHGEGLGDQGESQHGHLLSQGVMRVPLLIAGPGVTGGVTDTPVSSRRIFYTILDWAGIDEGSSLRSEAREVVLGEAMKPFLNYGWQPQVMAVEGRLKVIHAGAIEVYDVLDDPTDARDLSKEATLSRALRQALREYPVPSLDARPATSSLDDEERRRLASLGYVASDAKPVIRKDAPRPRDMAHLLPLFDRVSGLFGRQEYGQAIPLFEEILAADPHNLMAALQLAAAHSALDQNPQALAAFRRAESIAPDSPDVRHYLALHYVRIGEWRRALPLLERVLADSPHRLPALEAMATVRENEGRLDEALRLRQRAHTMKSASAPELIHLGELAMRIGNTPVALQAFEEARRLQGAAFRHDLELGVLYLDARRLEEARQALDRVPPSHPGRAMALFKRAQLSVLLREPDRAARIDAARRHADETTRALIESERLFREAGS